MAKYQYKARDESGKLISGIMEAESEAAVAEKLKESEHIPISVEEAREKEGFISKLLLRFKKVKLSELNMFTRQLATLQRAGVPVLASLSALIEQSSNKIFKDALGEIARDVKGGSSLSQAFEKFPGIFGPLYVNMVKSGEEGGILNESLEQLADLGTHEEKIHRSIKAATRYPLMVVSAIVIAFIILILLVVPRFAKVYTDAGVDLPLPTRMLIWLNYAITKYWYIVLLALAAVIVAFRKFISTDKGRFTWDRLKLKFPVFGPLLTKIYMSRFSRVTGTLMHSGVPILRILELAATGVGNVVISQTIDSIREGVNEGEGMVIPMRSSRLFPPIVIQMVSVGEDTGKVDELLLFVADYYDAQVEYTIENFTSLIEPLLLLVLGCAVLFMGLGIFLPMWNLMALFKG